MIIALCFCALFFGAIRCDDSELLSVVVLYRHGDRTPIRPYPNDPYKNESYWPVGWGQLTNIGKKQHFLLGRWLRDRYKSFLPDYYSEKLFYIRSTDVDRTLMSAESNLAGLYPPKGRQEWNPQLPWQPIPIHTVPEKSDAILATKKYCPRYQKLQKDLYKLPFFKNLTSKYHDLFAYLTKYSGKLVNDLESLESLYSTFFIEQLYNLTLPQWTHNVYPNKMKYLAGLSFSTMSYTEEMTRLKIGLLINEITNHLQNATLHEKFIKFRVYSGHDMTIANVLMALGAFDYHCPPYTSTIIFELRKNQQSPPYVNIFYKNSSDVQKITLKGCEFNCKLDQFQTLLKPLLLTEEEWTEECKLGIFDDLHIDSMYLIMICLMLAALIVIISGVVFAIKCYKPYEEQTVYTQLPNDEVA